MKYSKLYGDYLRTERGYKKDLRPLLTPRSYHIAHGRVCCSASEVRLAPWGHVMLKRLLKPPLSAGLIDIDAPETSILRRRIVREKGFLNRLYLEWYRLLIGSLPAGEGKVIEIGSGGGFLSDLLPDVVTSDVLEISGVNLTMDAHRLPVVDGALRGILMCNVLHHLENPELFLREAARAVRPGGIVAMIEPWNTTWSRRVYRRLHHEAFESAATTWAVAQGGPLSGANGALPWILFARDKDEFERRVPEWRIETVAPLMPIAYLLSGGVSLRALSPGWLYVACRSCERGLARLGIDFSLCSRTSFSGGRPMFPSRCRGL